MTPELERFNHFLIVRNADGQLVHLSRAEDEVVFPAFDEKAGRPVELHVLSGSAKLDAAEKRSVLERAALAAELQGWTFMQILEAGEDDAMIYYSSNLNDGEMVEDYVARRGVLPPITALCLILQLLEDLVQLQSFHRLISHLKLSRLLVTVVEDEHLHLRVLDFGLFEKEKHRNGDLKRLSVEVCKLVFLLLTGHPFRGENPEQVSELTCLAPGLRMMLHTVLTDNTQAPETPDMLRDAVDEALAALVYHHQIDDARKHLLITDANPPPRLQLQHLNFIPRETLAPISEMAIDEIFLPLDESPDNPAPARHAIQGPIIWAAVTIGVICILLWLFSGDSGIVTPSSKREAPVVSTSDKAILIQSEKPKPMIPADEAPVIVRKAVIPSTDEIEKFRRRQAAGTKNEPQAPVTNRSELANPTANR